MIYWIAEKGSNLDTLLKRIVKKKKKISEELLTELKNTVYSGSPNAD